MQANIPSAAQVADSLKPMRMAELQELSKRSGVPFRTLLNIRRGVTTNPGIETIRQFFPFLAVCDQKQADPSAVLSSVAINPVAQEAAQ